MQECDVKFVLKKDFKEGNDNLFELIVSVVMYDPKMMFFRLFANGISDDVKRVQYAFTTDSIINIVNTIGISTYSVYVVEHVFGELFNHESTHYDFNALKIYNNELLIIYGISASAALFFVLIVHAIQTMMVILLGIYGWMRLSTTNLQTK